MRDLLRFVTTATSDAPAPPPARSSTCLRDRRFRIGEREYTATELGRMTGLTWQGVIKRYDSGKRGADILEPRGRRRRTVVELSLDEEWSL